MVFLYHLLSKSRDFLSKETGMNEFISSIPTASLVFHEINDYILFRSPVGILNPGVHNRLVITLSVLFYESLHSGGWVGELNSQKFFL